MERDKEGWRDIRKERHKEGRREISGDGER